ncbi:TIGR03943 family putative permease subunit [Almyronema epifaneia]|uniref:TIGR03943 family putative permease subunit n=1 Tax=Almyronema epifaneia S1 TaxID=2991925 RepID=A0ABW6IEV3_9CYAN
MNRRRSPYVPWADILDILVLLAWGVALLKYWLTGQLGVLLHPDYRWLSNSAAVVLLVAAVLRGGYLVQKLKHTRSRAIANPRHFTLLPPNLSSFMLLAVAVLGLIYTPQAFASDTALQRGITDTLTMTRSQPQQFRLENRPEDRSVVDWVRTINVYPEPDAYSDQAVNVSGFVIHPPNWPDNYLMVSRFVLTCCAADAYPVGLPVRLEGDRATYAPDTWLEVKGAMTTETLADLRQLVIVPTSLTEIPEPENPYEY